MGDRPVEKSGGHMAEFSVAWKSGWPISIYGSDVQSKDVTDSQSQHLSRKSTRVPPKIDIRYHCFCSVLLLGTLFNHAEEKLWIKVQFFPFSETDTGIRLLQFS